MSLETNFYAQDRDRREHCPEDGQAGAARRSVPRARCPHREVRGAPGEHSSESTVPDFGGEKQHTKIILWISSLPCALPKYSDSLATYSKTWRGVKQERSSTWVQLASAGSPRKRKSDGYGPTHAARPGLTRRCVTGQACSSLCKVCLSYLFK